MTMPFDQLSSESSTSELNTAPAPRVHRVVVVDDHPVVQLGWKQVINAAPEFHVVAAVGDRRSALDCLRNLRPDVLVTDISLGRDNGLSLIEEARKQWPELPILVVTMHPEKNFALKAFQSGALGYLQKDTAMVDLVAAMRTLVANGAYISPSMRTQLAAMMRAIGVPARAQQGHAHRLPA